MGELVVNDKEIVVPGEVLAKGMDHLPAGGAFRENDAIHASHVGIVSIEGRLIKVVPLNTIYIPKRGDFVIGRIIEITLSCWYVDIGFVCAGVIPLREGGGDYIPRGSDLSQYYSYGDYIVAIVVSYIKKRQVELSMKGPGLRKLNSGRIINVNPAKIPRIIGKQGSMVSMIKQMTDCRIVAGQNGIVWVSGADPLKEKIAVDAIKMIEEKAHHQGLTDEIKKFLETNIGR